MIVGNFLSFENQTELTMIPSNKTRKNVDHKIQIRSTPLLKYAVIYGANASGKSNLVEVFRFVKSCVSKVIPAESTSMFCKNKQENAEKPSVFELQFTVNNTFFAYGFSLILSQRKIVSEWLHELYQNGTSKMLFERESGKKPELGLSSSLISNDNTKFQTYLDDFDENSNSLFLTFMNQGKKYSESSKLYFFKEVYSWITSGIDVCTPHTSLTSFEHYYDGASLQKINNLIKNFDTGISEVCIQEISIDDLRKELPEEILNDILTELKKRTEENSAAKIKVSMRSNDSFFNIESIAGQEYKVTTIKLKHGKSFYDFKFKEESDGTRRLFDLLDMLLNKSKDKLYVIDEMERSLHPRLTARFIELFNTIHPNQKVQLIFTTHESSIMDQELFRRDEIWFLERDNKNCSSLYSLDKFKERYDKKLSKAYLEGRYGAIPIFSTFKFEED